MPSGGQNRKSVVELKASGTFKNHRHGKSETEEVEKPDSPDWATKEDVYKGIVGYLEETKTSRKQDHIEINHFCLCYVAYIQAQEVFERDGVNAKVGRKLAINVMAELQKEMRMFLAEYRLSPSTREKALPKDVSDDLSSVLAGFN